MDNIIQNRPYVTQNQVSYKNKKTKAHEIPISSDVSVDTLTKNDNNNELTFKGIGGKNFWFRLKKLSKFMSSPSELTNQIIAAIGTGIIAPAVILVSPGKGDENDKDKKKFQALRQPLSAVLAFLCQLPTTILTKKIFDHIAYNNLSDKNIFNDKPIKDESTKGKGLSQCICGLIPDKGYIKKHGHIEVLDMLKNFEKPYEDGKSLKDLLIEQIKTDYSEVNVELTDEEAEKLANSSSRRKKFAKDKYADRKHDEYMKAKFEELKDKNLDIKDSELLSDKIKDRVKQLFKNDYDKIEENAKLSGFDKFLRSMGFDTATKKLKKLKEDQDAFIEKKGLDNLKEQDPEILKRGTDARLKQFINARDGLSQKYFKNKTFYFSLGINIIMAAISCYILNFIHPRFKGWMHKLQHKNDNNQQQIVNISENNKKSEVIA